MENSQKPSSLELIKQATENYRFCYARKEGQGYVKKENCFCSNVVGALACEAARERMEFIHFYDKLTEEGLTRPEIISELEKMYVWEETTWIQYNVER